MFHLLPILTLLLPGLALASSPSTTPAVSPGEQCLAAVAAAVQRAGIPPRLLRSIAMVESGRADPATGRVAPWPWTINAAGAGHYFATRQEAIEAVRRFQASGIQSIDVGCAQVNLMHHPQAFPSVEAAFDPQVNADYAARFLASLHTARGSWPLAAAGYHSYTPEFGHAYAQKVRAAWPEAEQHGPWPVPPPGGAAAPAGATAALTDYRRLTPAFAARARQIDQDRARSLASTTFTPAFAARMREADRDRARRAAPLRTIAGTGRPVVSVNAASLPANRVRVVR
jgi:hypothetical protein